MKPSKLTFYIHNGCGFAVYVGPSKKKFKKMCRKHALPKKSVRDLVRKMSNGVHSVVIDVPVYLNGLKKEKDAQR